MSSISLNFFGELSKGTFAHIVIILVTLQENMPKALESVSILLIRKWEHRMKRWMNAYHGGLGAKEAQIQVCKFSSTRYSSHQRIPERVAAGFDV